MKKIVMTVLAAMSFSLVSANIENNNGVAKREYQFAISTYAISRALNLSTEQIDEVKRVNGVFAAEMMRAERADAAKKGEKIEKAMRKAMRSMREILDRDQYLNFVKYLELTLSNRGLK
ncbi:hypothetical protein [Prevotella ihumii]|uniref:hypothetical protein n=1 Tax=Prevotella ihumii TaxID=1917878 RepID=UPI0009809196|nr:hypothetical protein [Prevotella ihumii]